MREVVLLTGLPNFRARYVLRELLTDPETEVRALVRASSFDELHPILDALPPKKRVRVSILEGDSAAMDLGLSGKEFLTLAAEVDRIHHCAIATFAGVEQKIAETTNVGGAREALELAEASAHLKALVMHSLVFVSGEQEGVVGEADPIPTDGFRNPVEETLARAERMARAAMPKLPIVIARSGTIVGDSQTGEIDRLDGFYLLVLLIMTSPRELALPLPGRVDSPLHLVPVDYVARAATTIGRDPRAIGKTVHLVDPAPLSSRRVLDVIAQATGRRMGKNFISANVTKALLSAPGIDRIARSPRSLLDQLATRVSYDSTTARDLLAGTEIACPPFESYADVLVDHVRRRMDERRERQDNTEYDPLI